MRYFKPTLIVALLGIAVSSLAVRSFAEDKKPAEGFKSIFNGKDLTGWKGLDGYWSVKDGAIVGQETKENSKQTFLVYQGGPVGDFELHAKFKFATPEGNSGIQFRSKILDEAKDPHRVGGYQADFDATNAFTGIIYDEGGVAGGRGIMSKRGEKTNWDAENKSSAQPLPLNDAELKQVIKIGEWNEVVLKVEGNHIVYSINGHVTTDLTDESPKALKEGLLAFQLHQGYTMEIHIKDVELKKL